MIHVDRPWAVYLLAIGPLLLWLRLILQRRRLQQRDFLGNQRVLAAICKGRSTHWYHAKSLLLLLAWTSLSLAFMGPKGNARLAEGEQKSDRMARNIIIAVDASSSMLVADMASRESRFAAAKEFGELLIEQLPGDAIALYGFTSAASSLSPPTLDHLFSILMLRQMEIGEGGGKGTNFGAAIEQIAADEGEQNRQLHLVILISDGGDQALTSKAKRQLFMKKLKTLQQNGWRFFTVGVGTEKGDTVPNVTYRGESVQAPLDAALLKEIALAGGGRYFDLSNIPVLKAVKELVSSVNLEKGIIVEEEAERFVYDSYTLPCALCALLALFGFLFLPDIALSSSGSPSNSSGEQNSAMHRPSEKR